MGWNFYINILGRGGGYSTQSFWNGRSIFHQTAKEPPLLTKV